MNVKNYTSSVPVDRSVSLIEYQLVRAGAKNIGKSYNDEQEITGIVFQLEVNGTPFLFKLPSKADKVFARMLSDRNAKSTRPLTEAGEESLKSQAYRTAFKLLYDMILIQVSNILIDQMEPMEAFMPYLYDGRTDRTFFQLQKERNFKALIGKGSTE